MAAGVEPGKAVNVADGLWQLFDGGVPEFKGYIGAVIGDSSDIASGSNMALWIPTGQELQGGSCADAHDPLLVRLVQNQSADDLWRHSS